MIFLVDTNVWLESLLGQERSDEALAFLKGVQASQLVISDFSLHSIGVILSRYKQESAFEDFLSDTIEDSGVTRVGLDTNGLRRVIAVRREFKLDFDDAYQYVAAERYNLTLVSFDSHFDRTERGRKMPRDVTPQTEDGEN